MAEKKQCILFRKNTSDKIQLQIGNSGASVLLLTRDLVNGSMDTSVLAGPAAHTIVAAGPLFAGVNDLCLEDLNIVCGPAATTVTVMYAKQGSSSITLWHGVVPADKALRYSELTGFVIV